MVSVHPYATGTLLPVKVHDLLTELEMSSLLKFCRQGGEVLAKGVGVQAFHHGFRAFLDVSEHCQSTSSESFRGTDVLEPPRGGCLGACARFSRVSQGQLGQLGQLGQRKHAARSRCISVHLGASRSIGTHHSERSRCARYLERACSLDLTLKILESRACRRSLPLG